MTNSPMTNRLFDLTGKVALITGLVIVADGGETIC